MANSESRTFMAAEHFVESQGTIRDTAKYLGIPKSTVFYDLTVRLPKLNSELHEKVRDLMSYNKSVRHFRGGQSTKELHANKKVK